MHCKGPAFSAHTYGQEKFHKHPLKYQDPPNHVETQQQNVWPDCMCQTHMTCGPRGKSDLRPGRPSESGPGRREGTQSVSICLTTRTHVVPSQDWGTVQKVVVYQIR